MTAAATTNQSGDVGPEAGLRRTLRVARPAMGRLALATLLGAAAVGAGIGLIAAAAWLISRSAQHPTESAVALAVAVVQFFALSRGLARYGERLVGHDAAFRVLAELRGRVYDQLERIAPAGLPPFHRGDLLARVVDDVDSLQDLLLRVIPPFLIAFVIGVASVVAVAWILPVAGLILAAALVVAATVVPWLTKRLAYRSERTQAVARGEMTVSVVDLLEGAPDLVAAGAASTQLARVTAADAELTRVASATARTTGVGLGLTTVLAGLATWGTLVVGIGAVHARRLDGVLLAVIVLIPLAAFELVAPLPAATQTLERVRRAAARVFTLVDAPAPVREPAITLAVPTSPNRLEARSTSAHYADGPRVLDGVDLELLRGRRVAVVGPSGAGKSTLAAVLLRFLDYEGSLALDDVPLDRLDGDGLRRIVGLVDQETHLFDTSIAENLRIARREASDDDLRHALAEVGLMPWVTTLPQGLDTNVGVRGNRVSGGQRQRLALARAALAAFPYLVLDEPAEHLDVATADTLTARLLRTNHRQATMLVTHRLAGLDQVDEIVVLDAGRIVERGTHRELVDAGGAYARLWHLEQEPRVASVHIDAVAPDRGQG